MRPKCEVMAKEILPALRVAIVKKLNTEYKMTQIEIAKRLGITQPAVSQYLNKLRGSNYKGILKTYNLSGLVDEIAKKIATGKFKDEDFSKIYCLACSKL